MTSTKPFARTIHLANNEATTYVVLNTIIENVHQTATVSYLLLLMKFHNQHWKLTAG